MYDVVIIGGGVIGCAVAHYLTRFKGKFLLIEKNEDVCTGTSKANSAIIHAGFDALPGSKKAYFNVKGSRMMEKLSQDLQFSYKRNGALVLCFDEKDIPHLRELHQRGKKNGVQGLELLWGETLKKKEPRLSDKVVSAMYAPSSAIVCPFDMTIALAETAAKNDCQFQFDTQVNAIERKNGAFLLHTSQGDIESRVIISCAGVYADELHNQLCNQKIKITPKRGEYCLLDRKDGSLVKHTIFQLPTAAGKGVLVTPTVHGNLLIGPTATNQEDCERVATSSTGLDYAQQTAALSVPNLPLRDIITSFAGLRAHITEGASDDFIVGESADGFFEATGIESPGLSSAPAIGEYLSDAVATKLQLAKNDCYISTRPSIPRVKDLPFSERQALIAKNPAYGNIICRCETISEGEIIDAICRVPGARSLDGVKRRVRAGMGRCQGGFCSPKVMEILSRELGIPQTKLTKSGGDSFLVSGNSKEVF